MVSYELMSPTPNHKTHQPSVVEVEIETEDSSIASMYHETQQEDWNNSIKHQHNTIDTTKTQSSDSDHVHSVMSLSSASLDHTSKQNSTLSNSRSSSRHDSMQQLEDELVEQALPVAQSASLPAGEQSLRAAIRKAFEGKKKRLAMSAIIKFIT